MRPNPATRIVTINTQFEECIRGIGAVLINSKLTGNLKTQITEIADDGVPPGATSCLSNRLLLAILVLAVLRPRCLTLLGLDWRTDLNYGWYISMMKRRDTNPFWSWLQPPFLPETWCPPPAVSRNWTSATILDSSRTIPQLMQVESPLDGSSSISDEEQWGHVRDISTIWKTRRVNYLQHDYCRSHNESEKTNGWVSEQTKSVLELPQFTTRKRDDPGQSSLLLPAGYSHEKAVLDCGGGYFNNQQNSQQRKRVTEPLWHSNTHNNNNYLLNGRSTDLSDSHRDFKDFIE